MGKLIGIVLLVLGVWFAAEVYTKGSQHAFGGALAWLAGEELSGDDRSTADRMEDSVRRNMNAGAARTTGSGNPEAELATDDVMSSDTDDVEE